MMLALVKARASRDFFMGILLFSLWGAIAAEGKGEAFRSHMALPAMPRIRAMRA
jgi:hypothetical protein